MEILLHKSTFMINNQCSFKKTFYRWQSYQLDRVVVSCPTNMTGSQNKPGINAQAWLTKIEWLQCSRLVVIDLLSMCDWDQENKVSLQQNQSDMTRTARGMKKWQPLLSILLWILLLGNVNCYGVETTVIIYKLALHSKITIIIIILSEQNRSPIHSLVYACS